MKTKLGCLFIFLFIVSNSFCEKPCKKTNLQEHFDKQVEERRCCDYRQYAKDFLQDMVDVNREVFGSLETMKVLTWTLPFYIAARSADESLHSSFYTEVLHKNVGQMPEFLHQLSNKGTSILIILFSMMPLYKSFSREVRDTASVLSKGIISISTIRTILKHSLKSRSCLRPWNANFSCTERGLGGFPSGHMATISYTTTLFGLRHGLKWGVPLAAASAFVFASSVNSNRHYASQLVAGTGIGLMYAFASERVLKSRMSDRISMSLESGDGGKGAKVQMSYAF